MTAGPEYWFYHLERSRLEQALPPMLEKCAERGWRALVRSPDAERIKMLDDVLWTFSDASFLPHGTADAPFAARQPVLLTTEASNPNEAAAVFLIDDADPEPLAGVARYAILFDGADDDAVAAARKRWKRLKADGADISYRRQDERGRWEKTA